MPENSAWQQVVIKTELGREPYASLFAVLSNVEAVVRVRNFKP